MPTCAIDYIFLRFYFLVSIILRNFAADFSRTMGLESGERKFLGATIIQHSA